MVFYGPVATLYRRAAGVSVLGIAQIEGISLALCVALELPWGIVADRIGYRRTMLVCCGIYFVSKIVFWRAEGFGWFLLERVLLAVVMAGMSGVDVSILYLSCQKEETQRVFGVYQACGTAGLLAATGAYVLWIGPDYRLAGFCTGVSYGVAALLAFGLREVKPPQPTPEGRLTEFKRALLQLLRDARTLALLLAIALLNETHQTITVFLNQLQYVRAGMTDTQIGLAYGLATVFGLTGALSARATRRWRSRGFGSALYLAACAACLLLACTRSALLSVAAILLLRVAFSLFQPLQTELQNQRVTIADRATALSLNALLLDGAGIATNLTFGAAAQQSLPLALALGALFCLAGLALYNLGNR
jgi:predicted MFS family arabinose efflux permease